MFHLSVVTVSARIRDFLLQVKSFRKIYIKIYVFIRKFLCIAKVIRSFSAVSGAIHVLDLHFRPLPVFIFPDAEPFNQILGALEFRVEAIFLPFESGHVLHCHAEKE